MKFSSICTLTSFAVLGMAAPALVQRESEAAAAGALSPPVSGISAAINALEVKAFNKLSSANGEITQVFGSDDNRKLSAAKSALSTIYTNLYQDIKDATSVVTPITVFVPTNLQQGDIRSLTDSANSLQRTLLRLAHGLANANQYLPDGVKVGMQADTDSVKGSIRGLVDPLTNFISTAIQRQSQQNLNLTPLYAASDNLAKTVSYFSQAVGLPNVSK